MDVMAFLVQMDDRVLQENVVTQEFLALLDKKENEAVLGKMVMMVYLEIQGLQEILGLPEEELEPHQD